MKIIIDGLKQCFEDLEFQKLATDLGLPLMYKDPSGFEEFLANMEKTLEAALKSVDLYKPMD